MKEKHAQALLEFLKHIENVEIDKPFTEEDLEKSRLSLKKTREELLEGQ